MSTAGVQRRDEGQLLPEKQHFERHCTRRPGVLACGDSEDNACDFPEDGPRGPDFDGRTTVMLQRLPYHLSKPDVCRILDDLGFAQTYDSLSVPCNHKRGQNLGCPTGHGRQRPLPVKTWSEGRISCGAGACTGMQRSSAIEGAVFLLFVNVAGCSNQIHAFVS